MTRVGSLACMSILLAGCAMGSRSGITPHHLPTVERNQLQDLEGEQLERSRELDGVAASGECASICEHVSAICRTRSRDRCTSARERTAPRCSCSSGEPGKVK